MEIMKTTKISPNYTDAYAEVVRKDTFDIAVHDVLFDVTKLREQTKQNSDNLAELRGQMIERHCELLLQKRKIRAELDSVNKIVRRQNIASLLLSLVVLAGAVLQIVSYFF